MRFCFWKSITAGCTLAAGFAVGSHNLLAEDAKTPAVVAEAAPGARAEAAPNKDVPAAAAAAPQSDEPKITLNIGDPAPPIVHGTWIKGEPVDQLQSGQVYVVEFWATWCGPCRVGMPHISALQTEYGDKVRIIGFSQEKDDVVTEWLKKEREEGGETWDQTIKYSLAMDQEATMNKTWFKAAGRRGIPSAFLVGREGVIEWIGHPAAIDEPLAKVVAGTWDRATARKEYDKEIAETLAQMKAAAMQKQITAAMTAKDYDTAIKLTDEMIEKTPNFAPAKLMKVTILSLMGRDDEAKLFVDSLVKGSWDNMSIIQPLAIGIAAKRYPGTLEDAERLGNRAVELAGPKGYPAMHYLAKIYSDMGNLDKAIEWETKAFDASNGNAIIKKTLGDYLAKKEKPAKTETP